MKKLNEIILGIIGFVGFGFIAYYGLRIILDILYFIVKLVTGGLLWLLIEHTGFGIFALLMLLGAIDSIGSNGSNKNNEDEEEDPILKNLHNLGIDEEIRERNEKIERLENERDNAWYKSSEYKRLNNEIEREEKAIKEREKDYKL